MSMKNLALKDSNHSKREILFPIFLMKALSTIVFRFHLKHQQKRVDDLHAMDFFSVFQLAAIFKARIKSQKKSRRASSSRFSTTSASVISAPNFGGNYQ